MLTLFLNGSHENTALQAGNAWKFDRVRVLQVVFCWILRRKGLHFGAWKKKHFYPGGLESRVRRKQLQKSGLASSISAAKHFIS